MGSSKWVLLGIQFWAQPSSFNWALSCVAFFHYQLLWQIFIVLTSGYGDFTVYFWESEEFVASIFDKFVDGLLIHILSNICD